MALGHRFDSRTRVNLFHHYFKRYIAPHAHMVSRVTDDYLAMFTGERRAAGKHTFGDGFSRSSFHGCNGLFWQLTGPQPQGAHTFVLAPFDLLLIHPKE